ncbi:MAG TPA: FAD:protein FMN transferase [Acidimicrobiales bacterium]|nr:FAD:protein FMN transferase [Acidimicrobiales bacterium]
MAELLHTFPALGTTAVVAVAADRPAALAAAVDAVRAEVDACDLACSRFRPDSELTRLNAGAGRPVAVSDRLLDDLEAGLRAARLTDGVVDPTVGGALVALGYDRDFELVAAEQQGLPVLTFVPAPGWRAVHLDRRGGTASVPAGVSVDLGATAKARCADRAAAAATATAGCGVLVSLGGDVAAAGPAPAAGWRIRVTDDSSAPVDAPGQTVAITDGGLATSSVTVRRWRQGGRAVHHLVDPRRGGPADVVWRTVSVAAGSCLDANIASTAAVVLGAAGPAWLAQRGLAARLVAPSGRAVTVAGWPDERGREAA